MFNSSILMTKCGKIKTWDTRTAQSVLEMLAHHVPPLCSVVPTILSTAELLLPNATYIQELPSLRFVHGCHNAFLYITKTLALYQIGKANLVGIVGVVSCWIDPQLTCQLPSC